MLHSIISIKDQWNYRHNVVSEATLLSYMLLTLGGMESTVLPFLVCERALLTLEGDGLRDLKVWRVGEGLRSDLLHSKTSGPCEPIGSLILPRSVMVN